MNAALHAVLHLQACIVGPALRQCGESLRRFNESDARPHRTPKALCVKFILDRADFRESSPADRQTLAVRTRPHVAFSA
jgi:hypothetical protein